MNPFGLLRVDLILLTALLGSLIGSTDTGATILDPALRIDEPGLIRFVDGPDVGSRVRTFNVDLSFPFDRFEFGFVEGTIFTGVAIRPVGDASLFGKYHFTGGALVNFALKDNVSGEIFSIADPRKFARQYFFGEVAPSHSRNPIVTDPYYNALILEWDLSAMGSGLHGPLAFTLTQAACSLDGMQPAPVPIPGAVILFGSGLAALVGVRRGLQASPK